MKNAAERRAESLEEIKANIAEEGHHIYAVAQGPCPRFAYTIGISESIGVEVIFAGAAFYSIDETVQIINQIAEELKSSGRQRDTRFKMPLYGTFSLREVDFSWSRKLMLGALDFYNKSELPALQIIPDATHSTIDVPDLSEPWNPFREPIWQWLVDEWTYPVPRKSTGVTNLAALRGERITEVMRWEEDQWELFAGAGPDVPKDEMRVVPIGTLIAADQSLTPILKLPLEGGCWRDEATGWNPWGQNGLNA